MAEEKIGTVTDYYARIGVAAIRLTDGDLRVGEQVRFRGHTTDFIQTVASIEVDRRPIEQGQRGSEVAVKVRERVRPHDLVLRVGAS